jgi:hypothetical protein
MAIVILGNRPHSPVADPKVNPNVFLVGYYLLLLTDGLLIRYMGH